MSTFLFDLLLNKGKAVIDIKTFSFKKTIIYLYDKISNVINSENLSNPLQSDEPIDLNFGQNYQADAQKSSNGPKRRRRPRGSITKKRKTENSSVRKLKRERKN
ncbi:hypothetical protein BpHYR1_044810 [Brachionus plicatilis]|uniref:Uncharacterized protein n=1 Tax=Brachionus plicatilis TaxID=10195 RepID=A0A3M7QGN6_BRAPC|nr:hypothetical protein BpHYR1_044810 [Brachionus plicatilis]